MKKKADNQKTKSAENLSAEISDLRVDITKSRMVLLTNPPKDTNAVSKKKRKLAILLTELSKNNQEEQLKMKKG